MEFKTNKIHKVGKTDGLLPKRYLQVAFLVLPDDRSEDHIPLPVVRPFSTVNAASLRAGAGSWVHCGHRFRP